MPGRDPCSLSLANDVDLIQAQEDTGWDIVSDGEILRAELCY